MLSSSPATDPEQGPSAALVTVFAVATGGLVANLYYAQPLIAQIAPELGIRPDLAGSVVSVGQVGYGLGLFLLVSLADLVENKTLVLTTIGITTLALVGAALSTSGWMFFAAAALIGLCSTGAQMLIPFVSRLVPEKRRGRVVGNVMAGLLTGIMLARPAALFIAASFGWRAVFWCSALFMAVIWVALARAMPSHKPAAGLGYGRILASMVGMLRDMPALRWRAAYQFFLFGSFNMFWTAVPLILASRFGLNQRGIGLFALAGAGGALAAPIAGRFADRGLIRAVSLGSAMMLALAFWGSRFAVEAGALGWLVASAVLIDMAVQATQVATQRIIFSVGASLRGRINAIYMTLTFIGGAIGSIAGTISLQQGGWEATAAVGAVSGTVVAGLMLAERGRGTAAQT